MNEFEKMDVREAITKRLLLSGNKQLERGTEKAVKKANYLAEELVVEDLKAMIENNSQDRVLDFVYGVIDGMAKDLSDIYELIHDSAPSESRLQQKLAAYRSAVSTPVEGEGK